MASDPRKTVIQFSSAELPATNSQKTSDFRTQPSHKPAEIIKFIRVCGVIWITAGLHLGLVANAQSLPKFGLVFGSDTSLKRAQFEIDRFNSPNTDLARYPLSNYRSKAAIFLRNGNYRSLLLFNTEEEAKASKPVIDKYLQKKDRQAGLIIEGGRRPFVVNLESFCPRWFLYRQSPLGQVSLPVFKCR
jgi:hypothetical protein